MRRAGRLLLWFTIATAIGLFFSTQLYLIQIFVDRTPMRWGVAVLATLPEWYLWALLAPSVFWLSRRFPIGKATAVRNGAAHLLFGALISMLHMALITGFYVSMGWKIDDQVSTFPAIYLFLTSVRAHWHLVTYVLLVAGAHAVDNYRKLQEREARLAQARLQALRSQLHPHFLFNSLHATLALIRKDPAAAERMVVRLGELLRTTLETSGNHEVPLRNEIHFLEQYLEVERTRFADRLTIDIDVDPATLDAAVPNMILQPLVENAVKHGIAPRADAGHIQVRSFRDNGSLVLEISDNGAGLAVGPPREGIGLANTRARLRQLYGDRQSFELATPPAGGFTARLRIPFER